MEIRKDGQEKNRQEALIDELPEKASDPREILTENGLVK
jgi:hypothetical protein